MASSGRDLAGTRHGLGRRGEDAACRYLRARGLALIERNFRARTGEIDLVMRDGQCLVFVEVRVRGRSAYGDALESVDRAKQARLTRAAEQYLATHPEAAESACRFDVLALEPRGGRARIQWIRGAFEA